MEHHSVSLLFPDTYMSQRVKNKEPTIQFNHLNDATRSIVKMLQN